MANSDAAFLSELKTARDAITTAIAEGRLTVEYLIRGRRHRVEQPTVALRNLDELIVSVQSRINRASRRRNRVAKLSYPQASSD